MTVLFVDLVDSTGIAETLPPEDVRELLSGYFDLARTVVGRHGGRVEKFIGDAVMAVWGSPVAREDDAERAVRASLDLVTAVATYGEASEIERLQARAGLVTGRAATWTSVDEGLVVGDMVNTASRVQSLADPGEVLVDDTTHRSTAAAIVYNEAGEHVLRGRAEPLRLWKAARVVAGIGGAMRVDGLEAHFMGRSRDLALVKALFHATVEDGRARLVLVSAAAGSGKSRLGWEFEKYVDGLSSTVLWHSGRCLSYGDGIAFWALAEIVRQRLDIAEDDPKDAVAAKLADQSLRWFPDDAERSFVAPRLGTLLGAGKETFEPDELFAGWRMFLERLAAAQPVVLFIEDLHWADAGLLGFLDHLLDWSASHRIFVLATARPELAEQRPDWPPGRRNVTRLHLELLPDRVVAELVRELVPDIPEGVTTQIVEQAAGVPLYAVESIRSLVDRDLVVARDGVYTMVGDVGELAIPVNLISLIAARLDTVPTDERALLQSLAVLGTTFARAAVRAVTDAADHRIEELLRSLVRREFLTVRSDPLSPERGQYRFEHDLVRSVAYDSMPRRLRKARHVAAAQHVRSAFPNDGEDVVEVVAAHYHDAYRAARGDTDRDEHRVEAMSAYTRAGQRAARLGAPEAAEQSFRRAAELATEPIDRAHLLEAAGTAASDAGRYAPGVALLEAAWAELQPLDGRTAYPARLAVKMGFTLSNMDRTVESITVMRAALDALDGSDSREDITHLHGLLGSCLWYLGQSVEAQRHTKLAVEAARSDNLGGEELSRALRYQADILDSLGEHSQAMEGYAEAVDVAHRCGSVRGEATALHHLGYAQMNGDDPGSLHSLSSAASFVGRLGSRGFEASVLSDLAICLFLSGEWIEAERIMLEVMAASNSESHDAADAGLHLCELYRLRGQPVKAELLSWLAAREDDDEPLLREMAAGAHALLARERGNLYVAHRHALDAAQLCVARIGLRDPTVRWCWPLAVEMALASDQVEDAESALAIVADAPAGQAPPYLLAQLSRYRGLVAAGRGVTDGVEALLTEAVGAMKSLSYPYWHARSQLDLGSWLADQGRVGEAVLMLSPAKDTLDRLGAGPDLYDARRLLSELSPATDESHA